MSKLQLLGIWMHLKRWLRSLLFAVGMKKTINWREELDEMLEIVNDTLDVQQEAQAPNSDPPASTTEVSTSPYDQLKPEQTENRTTRADRRESRRQSRLKDREDEAQ